MPRAVFDTSILISAFLAPNGVSADLIAEAHAGTFTLVLAPEIIGEARRKLLTGRRIRKAYSYSDEAALKYCVGLAEIAEMVHELPPLTGIVRDPSDDMIVACAVKAGADCIVSRDKDLLSLGTYQGTTVTTPERFRRDLRRTR